MPSCRTWSSFACICGLISPISSSRSVPLLASSNLPGLARTAPVNAPTSYPKSSLSRSSVGSAAQFTLTKFLLYARGTYVTAWRQFLYRRHFHPGSKRECRLVQGREHSCRCSTLPERPRKRSGHSPAPLRDGRRPGAGEMVSATIGSSSISAINFSMSCRKKGLFRTECTPHRWAWRCQESSPISARTVTWQPRSASCHFPWKSVAAV